MAHCAVLLSLFSLLFFLFVSSANLSAYDGWGFTSRVFAPIIAAKTGLAVEDIVPHLWGDFYLTKGGPLTSESVLTDIDDQKPVLREGARDKGRPPVFAAIVLQSIWDVYNVRFDCLFLFVIVFVYSLQKFCSSYYC